MRIALTIMLSIFALSAQAGRIEEVKSMLDRSVYACPERIWDGLDWKKARITLVSQKQNKGIVLQNGAVTDAQADDMQFSSTYDFQENGILVNVDSLPSSQEAFAFVVHEGFHSFGQKYLPYHTDGREEVYPAKYEPRVEREELSRALVGFFRGEVGSLEKAAEWNKRHKLHNEKLGSDVIEGSAEYVEVMATAVMQLGCSASEIALVQNAVDAIADQGASFSKELEHYRIGALSFLLSRPKLDYVLSKLDGTNLPLDIVLEKVVPNENVVADNLLEYAIESSVAMTNKQAETVISPIKEALNKKEAFAFIPFKNLKGSFTHSGAYVSEGKTYYEDLQIETARGPISGNGVQVTIDGEVGFLVQTEQPINQTTESKNFEGSPIAYY